MKVLVTGATGKIGHAITRALLLRGDDVRALVRDPERARTIVPGEVELVRGDVTDPQSLIRGVAECELVFNAMGLPQQWLPDKALFNRVNAAGSEALVEAARAAGVKRLVHTSTEDVFHAEPGGSFNESDLADYPKGTPYGRSKQLAEERVLSARNGLEIVIVNPAAAYGPGPLAPSAPEKGLFEPLVKKRLPALPPGGFSVVFVDGVAAGHLLAAERGRDGERYLLSDQYVPIRELAKLVVRLAGRGWVPPTMPTSLAKTVAQAGEVLSRLTRRPPLLPSGLLHYFMWEANADSAKAQRELGWQPTPLEQGIRRTLAEMEPPLI